jgi:hypothetical protein
MKEKRGPSPRFFSPVETQPYFRFIPFFIAVFIICLEFGMGGAELTRICRANYSDGYVRYTHYGQSYFRGKRIFIRR